jgi:hypothetical protein
MADSPGDPRLTRDEPPPPPVHEEQLLSKVRNEEAAWLEELAGMVGHERTDRRPA